MKALVLIRNILNPKIGTIITDNQIKYTNTVINPTDECALEEAVLLKEKGVLSTVIAVHIGDNLKLLQHAIAMGATDAILLKQSTQVTHIFTAKVVAHMVKEYNIDCVMLGDCDDCDNDLAVFIAGYMRLNHINHIIKITNQLSVSYYSSHGIVSDVKLVFPSILAVNLSINKPRFVKLPQLMKAKKFPYKQIDDIGFSCQAAKIHSFKKTSFKRECIKLDSFDKFVDKFIESLPTKC